MLKRINDGVSYQ